MVEKCTICEDCEEADATRIWGRWEQRQLCDTCWHKRDNYDPPDPDGEDLFRDYQAEQRDAMEAARKLK